MKNLTNSILYSFFYDSKTVWYIKIKQSSYSFWIIYYKILQLLNMPYQMTNQYYQNKERLRYNIPFQDVLHSKMYCTQMFLYTGRPTTTVTRSPPFAYFKCWWKIYWCIYPIPLVPKYVQMYVISWMYFKLKL